VILKQKINKAYRSDKSVNPITIKLHIFLSQIHISDK
jgi:hypothetical protein